MSHDGFRQHSSHWGSFQARADASGHWQIRPFEQDPAPSALLDNIPAALDHPARLTRPLVRRGWLSDGPGPDSRRGRDSYVEMDWDEALDLAARELRRLGAGLICRRRATCPARGCLAAPMAGPRPGGSIMRKASCTAF